eukprot:gnl/MRDRNA2_/MRDRNA2_77033_c0_seq1.p1 gnl/MRDRNA2_/MRDRNA2_77033_c0~~gnl/MRDRNA2_/MRDRNA2_77033_c0_seq1.p1  ORF type:complete len:445 (+),score=45.88 gnl/MRDRNA2_/MRDRNA2_77033_c0_seq1:163-1497(+)
MDHDDDHWLEYSPDTADKEPLLEHKQPLKAKKLMSHGSVDSIGHIESAGHIISDKFDEPTCSQLVITQIVMTLGYMAYMMSSWLDTTMRHKDLFPICSEYWASSHFFLPLMGGTCVSSILIYWTFPIFCCLVLLMYFYRDLLLTKMYYVMFVHQVHLDFRNVSFFGAVSVRIMLCWCVLCVLMYPLTGKVGVHGILQTLPFWMPVISFCAMLYSHWDLEKRLLSVAKLVENDVEWAGNHVKNSFFLRDYIAEKALHQVRDVLDQQIPAPQLSTGEYIVQIAAEAVKIQKVEDHRELKKLKKSLKKEHSTTIFHAISPRYWVYQFLYSPYLVDDSARDFHHWFRIYYWFTFVCMTLLVFFWLSTILTLFTMQKIVYLPPWLDFNWINWLASSGYQQQDYSKAFGFLQIFQGETQAYNAEISALQQQNAALLSEVASLKARLLLSP